MKVNLMYTGLWAIFFKVTEKKFQALRKKNK